MIVKDASEIIFFKTYLHQSAVQLEKLVNEKRTICKDALLEFFNM